MKEKEKSKKDSLYSFIFTRSEHFKEFFNFYKRQILTMDLNAAGKAKIKREPLTLAFKSVMDVACVKKIG